jgi:hypothetical protein
MDAEWPRHFPCGCPDAAEAATTGIVFHLLRYDVAEDFTSARERGAFKDGDECLRAAMSCYRELDSARRHLALQPSMFRAIAALDLKPEHGHIKHTPSKRIRDHYSLWLRSEYQSRCAELFMELSA